jgi:hypothetical protein
MFKINNLYPLSLALSRKERGISVEILFMFPDALAT